MFLVNASIMLLLKMYNTSIMLIHILPEIKKLKLISITFLAKNCVRNKRKQKNQFKNCYRKVIGRYMKIFGSFKKASLVLILK